MRVLRTMPAFKMRFFSDSMGRAPDVARRPKRSMAFWKRLSLAAKAS